MAGNYWIVKIWIYVHFATVQWESIPTRVLAQV
jgi:hypothetical protein